MEYSDFETEQKLAFCQQRLGSWTQIIGGQVVTNTDDDEVQLRTRAGDRPVRIVVDYDTGWTTMQTKITNTTGVLVLNWDPEKQPQTQAADNDWDDGNEQRMFLAPGLYIEEYPEEAKAMWALLGRLPQELVQELMNTMPTRISYLNVDADKIDMRFEPNFDKLHDPGLFQYLFGMCDRIARVFEAGSESVAAKPKVYIGGKPANIGNVASCPHCNTIVDISDAAFCFNCGAPMKPKL